MHINRYILTAVLIVVFAAEASTVQAGRVNYQHAQAQAIPQRLDNLDLTPAQQKQFHRIQQETHGQIMKVLTSSQQQKFQQSIESGQNFKQIMPSLGLSFNQMLKLRKIVQGQKQEMEQILTPSQRQKLKQFS